MRSFALIEPLVFSASLLSLILQRADLVSLSCISMRGWHVCEYGSVVFLRVLRAWILYGNRAINRVHWSVYGCAVVRGLPLTVGCVDSVQCWFVLREHRQRVVQCVPPWIVRRIDRVDRLHGMCSGLLHSQHWSDHLRR